MAAAASSSNKNLSSCCSPVSGRPTNAVSRNSEISNPMRRSFSGTPFAKPSILANQRSGFNPNTPNNSPSDHPRIHSTSRENFVDSLRDHEEKENSSKDHSWKQARIRSPAPSKGTKNFMSPTISAASKVNASPRKKILAERNEPVCSSVSFNDAKSPVMEDLESKPEKGMNQKKDAVSGTLMEDLESKFEEGLHKKREVSFDSTVTFIGGNENSYSKEEDTNNKEDLDVGNDCVNLDPTFKISPKAVSYFSSPALAPLDADPSVPPPYDPKTNYLSPRPMFLHYRPNPRIGVHLNKERDGKQLEETFISECLSEADASEEESLSEDSQKESEDASSCDQSTVEDDERKERGKEKEEEEKELLVSEPNPSNKEEELLVSELNSSNTSEGMVEIKRRTKSPFITRTKLTALVLAVAMAFLYVSFANSPIMDPSVLNNLSFPELQVPPQITEFTRQNFEDVAQKFQLWLAHTLSSTRDMINNLRERPKIGPLQYANLTILLEDGSVDVFDDNVLGAEINDGNSILEHVEEGEVDDGEDKLVESFEGIGESVESCDDSDDQESEEQEIAPFDDNVEIPMEHVVLEAEYTAIATIPDETPATEVDLQGIKVLEDEPVTISQIAKIHPEVADSRQLRSTEELSSEFLVIEPVALILQTAETQPEVPDTMQLPLSSEFLVIEPVAPILQTSETEPEVPDTMQLQSTEEADSASDTKSFAVESIQESLVVDEKAASSAAISTQLDEFLAIEPVAPILQTSKTEPEVPDTMQLQSTEEADSASDTKSFAVERIQESLVVDEKEASSAAISTQLDELQDVSSAQTMLLAISFLVLGLLAAVAFICVKTRTPAKTNNAPDNLALMTKKLGCTTTNMSISAEHNFQDGQYSRNWATEVDMVGDSCPSEMSSYQNSLCYSKKGLKDTTTRDYSSAQSQETKPRKNNYRRESLASSDYSMGGGGGATASYGSFTTYEKIHIKQGNADEEVITPVRRSSRIRKQVTSP